MKAVILAGGKGTRMRPLTYAIPKVLLPINERPMLEHIIYYLKEHGITEVIISIGYLAHQIKNYLGDGSKMGVKIEYIEEKEPLGTAGCLNLCRDKLTETFILMGGDNVTTMDLTEMIEFHKKKKAEATVGLFELQQSVEYGVYDIDKDNRVKGFQEKPTFTYLAGTMIFVLEPSVLDYVPKYQKMPKLVNLTDHILPQMLKEGRRIFGFPFSNYWVDVGRMSDFEKVNKISEKE